MKLIFSIIIIGFGCNWNQINETEIITKEIGVMLAYDEASEEKEFGLIVTEGACGGTARKELDSFHFEYCEKKKRLQFYVEVIYLKTNETVPYCSLIKAKKTENKYTPNSSEFKSNDESNVINGEIDYIKGEKLFIWGLGTTVIQIEIK